jgi:hypothetical protein
MRHTVELHRNYCLLAGQAFFLCIVGLKDNVDDIVCAGITFITHYAWMAVFSWTGMSICFTITGSNVVLNFIPSPLALEGILLFFALVLPFRDIEDHYWLLYSAGYGIALLISAGTLITSILMSEVTDEHYFRADACWLDGNYIWAFKGPVALIVAGNTVILIIGIYKSYEVIKKRPGVRPWQKARGWTRSFLTLSYLLGITWLVGYFEELTEVTQYIFVILNASSGIFILFYSVIFNRKIREASQKKLTSTRNMTFTSKISVINTSSDVDGGNRTRKAASGGGSGGSGSGGNKTKNVRTSSGKYFDVYGKQQSQRKQS